MYESYWGLREKPFRDDASGEFFFPAETHQTAMLKLRYAIDNRHSAVLLLGPPGMGKSLLVRRLRQSLPETFRPVIHLAYPFLTPAELPQYIACEGGWISPDAGSPATPVLLHALERGLREVSRRGERAVVILEEAQLWTSGRYWETLRTLMNLPPAEESAWSFVISAQPEILPVLRSLPHLEERLTLRCRLKPFAPDETRRYIRHRLTAAGSTRDIFTEDAATLIHDLSGGIPRRIHRLCDLALFVGFAEKLDAIRPEHVEAVHEELTAVTVE
ncbi:AAA family ATPase [Thermopirellula anaerolimosa]